MALVNGSNGPDSLDGTAEADTINGLDGNDTLFGLQGNDVADGGDGDDSILGSAGDDILAGGADNDTISGEADNDTLDGGDGDDDLIGDAGDDSLVGAAGFDFLLGGAGNDTLAGGEGDDSLVPDAGNDMVLGGGGARDHARYDLDPAAVIVDLTSGLVTDGYGNFDTISGVEDVNGTGFNDTIVGAAADNRLRGGDGRDLLSGAGGNDTLHGEGGNDTLLGDAGTHDVADFSNNFGSINVDLATGVASVGPGNVDSLSGIEDVIGGDGTDFINGSGADNRLQGGVGSAGDALLGGDGNDTLEGGDGNDILVGGNGDDVINGGAGDDAATYPAAMLGIVVNLVAGTAADGLGTTDTLISIEQVDGGGFNDTMQGDAADNLLFGNAGADSLNGGDGDDRLFGDQGDDTLDGGADNDTLRGDFGNDAIRGGLGSDTGDFIGNRVIYIIAFQPDGSVVVDGTIASQGVDTLTGVEFLKFADVTIPVPPLVTIAPGQIVEGDAGTANLEFTISLSAASTLPVVVTASTSNGGATAGSDYIATSLQVTIPAGQTSGTFSVPIIGDTVLEPNETFIATLSNATNATIGVASSATGTILDDEIPVLSIAPAQIAEGDAGPTNLEFTISLSKAFAQPVVVTASTGGGSAISGVDFVATQQEVTIPAGEISGTFTVAINGDTAVEGDETFTVGLSGPQNAVLGAQSQATGTILDDDVAGPPTLSIAAAEIAEGDAGAANLSFTISLSQASQQQVVVTAATSNGTAAAGSDYTASNAQVTIPAGQTSATFQVPILGDVVDEADESFTVTLSNPQNATLGAQFQATGTILDNDGAGPPSLSIAATSANKAEGNGGSTAFTFTVTRAGDTSGASTADFAVTGSGGSPAAAADFAGTVLPAGQVSFAAGETSKLVTINVAGDTAVEPDEGFTVTLSNPSGATLGTAAATGTIVNDDAAALPALSIAAAQIVEGDANAANLMFTISLSAASAQAVTVTAATSNGTATAGSDYTATNAQVTIPAGQTSGTFQVPIQGDTELEPNESFTVTLSSPSNATLGVSSSAIGTIVNDDAPPLLSIADALLTEANGNLVFTISLSRAVAQGVSVQASTLNGAALAGSDYTATSTLVTIPAGQTSATFAVPVLGDASFEIDEAFLARLSNPTGGAAISNIAGMAKGTIVNDDLPVLPTITGQTINGGAGDDFLVGTALNDSIIGNAGADTEFGNEQSDILIGGDGDDFIVADFPANFLFGESDFIDVGNGNDNVFGGGGDDTIIGGNGNDLLASDTGNNLVFGGDGDNALYGFDGADTLLGGNDGDIVFGLSGPDVIVTQRGLDLIIAGGDFDGPGDADFIDIGDGAGSVFAGSGNDTVLGGDGADFILGESGADLLSGGSGADALIAGPGADTIEAGAGDDIIIAEGGNDLLTGGSGLDQFRYPAGIAVDADAITDFAPADDTIELAASLGFATGALALAAVTQVDADAVLTLPGGGSITLLGVPIATLSAADFQIV